MISLRCPSVRSYTRISAGSLKKPVNSTGKKGLRFIIKWAMKACWGIYWCAADRKQENCLCVLWPRLRDQPLKRSGAVVCRNFRWKGLLPVYCICRMMDYRIWSVLTTLLFCTEKIIFMKSCLDWNFEFRHFPFSRRTPAAQRCCMRQRGNMSAAW